VVMKYKRFWIQVGALGLAAVLAAVLGSHAPQLIKKWNSPIKNGNFISHIAAQPYKLTLYGTTSCPHCAEARAFLKKNGVNFNDLVIDQSESAEAAFKLLEQRGVPVLVSEKHLIEGFNAAVYVKFLESIK
jgi:glutaredoxin